MNDYLNVISIKIFDQEQTTELGGNIFTKSNMNSIF